MEIPTRLVARVLARAGRPRFALLMVTALGSLALLGVVALGAALAPPPETIVIAPFRW